MHRISLTMTLGALVALVAAAPAAGAAENAPVVKTVVKKLPVRQGRVVESKVFCPSTMAAIAGTVVRQPSGSTLQRSLPSGVRSWRFAFGGTKRSNATALVRCAALKVPRAAGRVNLNVNTVSRGLGVNAGRTGRQTINCRAGYVPTAWGFANRAPTTTQFFKALSNGRGYAFGAENFGSRGNVVTLRVRCLDQAVAGKAGLSHRWRVKRQRYSNRIRSGVRTVRHSCSAGYVSIGLGHGVASQGDSVFRRSYDLRTRSARWVFRNGSGIERVTTQALCLNTRTQFR
jgi:hypothetical protein